MVNFPVLDAAHVTHDSPSWNPVGELGRAPGMTPGPYGSESLVVFGLVAQRDFEVELNAIWVIGQFAPMHP
jgi:hypothetical protein